MPTFDLTVLLTKFYYIILRFRSKKGEGIYSPETEEKLAPVGSDVATVFVFILSFSNHSFFSSFSNASIFSILRRIISPSRFFKKACCLLQHPIKHSLPGYDLHAWLDRIGRPLNTRHSGSYYYVTVHASRRLNR